MNKWHQFVIFASVICITCGDVYSEEEDMNYYLEQLYKDPGENMLDPHDMLNYGRREENKIEKDTSIFGKNFKTEDPESCSFDKMKLEEGMQKFAACQEQLQNLGRDVEIYKQKLRNLEKKLVNEGSVDMKAYYRRMVHLLWNVLELKDVQNILKENDEAIVRQLLVRVSQDDIHGLLSFLEHEDNIHQVDEFLQNAFELRISVDYTYGFSIQSAMEWAQSVFEVGKNVEMWLYALCIGFLLLGMWAIYLFIKDVQRELRWMRVIMMMIVLMFFICCLWHWRHMHKVAESRRHAKMMKRGFNNIPEECKPGGQGTTHSVWEWIKVRAFGAPDVCEKYFEELMIDPSEEITPAMVIAETLAKFFLQPLQHLGSESAKFITNFYQNVPVVYHIPATIFFIVLLIIILFAFCGYGIDFPLWMGGIRPIYRTESADTSDVDRITKEAIAQLQNDREKFMAESHKMLTDIANAAASTQVQTGIQPLLMMSSDIMESQLERLITRQLSNVISQRTSNNSLSHGSPSDCQNLDRQNSNDIMTVTSTPLRGHYELQSSGSMNDNPVGNEDVRDSKDKSTAYASNKDDGSGSGTMMVTTDAVHYRLKGTPRKRELPPRDGESRPPSRAPSNCNVSGRIESPVETNSDVAGVRRRIVGQKSGSESPSSSQSELHVSRLALSQKSDSGTPSSSHLELSASKVLNDPLNETISSDESVSGENFFSKVKSILEDSANSSMNLDTSSVSEDQNRSRITRSLSGSRLGRKEQEVEEEIELSASGVKFLSKIEKVMTP